MEHRDWWQTRWGSSQRYANRLKANGCLFGELVCYCSPRNGRGERVERGARVPSRAEPAETNNQRDHRRRKGADGLLRAATQGTRCSDFTSLRRVDLWIFDVNRLSISASRLGRSEKTCVSKDGVSPRREGRGVCGGRFVIQSPVFRNTARIESAPMGAHIQRFPSCGVLGMIWRRILFPRSLPISIFNSSSSYVRRRGSGRKARRRQRHDEENTTLWCSISACGLRRCFSRFFSYIN